MNVSPLMVVGLVVVLGVMLNFTRLWLLITGGAGNARARASRISEYDAHLSFDERLAERLRELGEEQTESLSTPLATPQSSQPAQTGAAPTGFGRRGL